MCDLLIVMVVIGFSEISLWIEAGEKCLLSTNVPISTDPLQMFALLLDSALSKMLAENAIPFDLLGHFSNDETDGGDDGAGHESQCHDYWQVMMHGSPQLVWKIAPPKETLSRCMNWRMARVAALPSRR